MLQPKLLATLKDYTKSQFFADLGAGLTVGIVALPLAIAFAIASGVSPERGLITAVLGGFLISALGGSRVQIGGPTGAFIIIVLGIVQQYGVDGLLVATLIAGVLLVLMGLAKLGSVIKYIPYTITVGFTSGIAVIIFTTQMRDFFGLSMGEVPGEFHEKWIAYASAFPELNISAFALGAASLLLLVAWPRFVRKVPGSMVVIALASLAVWYFQLPVETIGSRFGDIRATIPAPHLPAVDWSTFKELFGPAVTIALLCAIEALLSAVVADGMIGGSHRSNMELVAQGAANIVSPLFGGIPATGAIARTATNVKNGGRTPVAGMIHAVVLLLIMLFLGSLVRHIPLASLAAILIVVAYNMSEWRSFVSMLRGPRSDVIVLLVTFLLTVFVDLTVAIQVGIVLSALLFIRRMAMVSKIDVISSSLEDQEEELDAFSISSRDVPPGVEVYEIRGPFFFGAANKFKEAMRIVDNPPKIFILRMRDVPAIDATGLHVLEELVETSHAHGIKVILSGLQPQPLSAVQKAGLPEIIGQDSIAENIDVALQRARDWLHGRST